MYVGLAVQLHGDALVRHGSAEAVRAAVEAALRQAFTDLMFDDDITVEVEESAGFGEGDHE
jgi:hypothetical protein